MALLGIYVGVIPIALGMLWLPWIRRIPPSWLRVVMALTVGLLAFLAIDATLEGVELAGEGSQAFGGVALVFLGAAVAYLALTGVGSWLAQRRRRPRRGRRVRLDARAAHRRRDRPAQPRRGPGDRHRLHDRGARARRLPRRRLRAAQHDGGTGDRRADRRRAAVAGAPGAARARRGRARRARRLDRRRRRSTPRWPRSSSAPARARSRRSSSSSRRRCATTGERSLQPRVVGGLLAGLALMFATGLLVSV